MDTISTKAEFDALPRVNGIPRVVWAAWFGGQMSDNRLRGIAYMQEHLQIPICMITADNIDQFLLPDYPLHEAFEYLSSVHKSDYLRSYLARFYGGAWHDIKPTAVSYVEAFDEFASADIYWKGKPEIEGLTAKVYDKSGNWMPDCWQKLIAASPYICRADTPMTRELFDDMNALLDENMQKLRSNPARSAYAHKIRHYSLKRLFRRDVREAGDYPLNVTVFGDLLHPLVYKYYDHVSRLLPYDKEYCLNFPYR